MATKNATLIQNKPPIVGVTTQLAKELINKHPGIYEGNLRCRILYELPKATKLDMEYAILQLIKEGFFFSMEDDIYPPNRVNKDIKDLTNFVYYQNLSFTDYGILYELNKTKIRIKRLSELSRIVLSQGWSQDESEIKNNIQSLFQRKLIICSKDELQVNWRQIKGGIK